MPDGWQWVDQGSDEFHVYRRIRPPHYEVHGYRLNRCGWLWMSMLNDDFAGKREHAKLEDAIAEAERMSERARLRALAARLAKEAQQSKTVRVTKETRAQKPVRKTSRRAGTSVRSR